MNAKEITVKIAEIVAEQEKIFSQMEALPPGQDDEWTRLRAEHKSLTKKLVVLQDDLIDQLPLVETVDTRSDDEIFQDMTNS